MERHEQFHVEIMRKINKATITTQRTKDVRHFDLLLLLIQTKCIFYRSRR
jgi:hypothetical protein